MSKEPAWYANVWYVDGLHIRAERQSESSVIQSFSFLKIKIKGNRNAFQMYSKYLFSITSQSVATIRIQYTYVREFLRYLEEKHMVVSEIDITVLEKYFEYLMVQKLEAQSCNNKLREIMNFIGYLQAKELIRCFEIPMDYFLKKAYPSKNEIRVWIKAEIIGRKFTSFSGRFTNYECNIDVYRYCKRKIISIEGIEFLLG